MWGGFKILLIHYSITLATVSQSELAELTRDEPKINWNLVHAAISVRHHRFELRYIDMFQYKGLSNAKQRIIICTRSLQTLQDMCMCTHFYICIFIIYIVYIYP